MQLLTSCTRSSESFTNHVRFFYDDSSGRVLLNQAVNELRGILQWHVRVEQREDGTPVVELDLVSELEQRDYPNSFAVSGELEDADGEPCGRVAIVNDGMLGSICRVERGIFS